MDAALQLFLQHFIDGPVTRHTRQASEGFRDNPHTKMRFA
jgi:hypothetical protein